MLYKRLIQGKKKIRMNREINLRKILVMSSIIHETALNVGVIKFNILRPVLLVLANGKIKPWLVVSIVVHHGCIVYLFYVHCRVVPKTEHVPGAIEGVC